MARLCECGCKPGLLPADAPARRRFLTPACRLRAFQKNHIRVRDDGREYYKGTAHGELRTQVLVMSSALAVTKARIAALTAALVKAGVPVPPEEV